MLDLDIARFPVTKGVRLGAKNPKPVFIKLFVRNEGTVEQAAPATVVGSQGGIAVYTETLQVSDPLGNGRSTLQFTSSSPDTPGEIFWTVTLDDGNPVVGIQCANGLETSFIFETEPARFGGRRAAASTRPLLGISQAKERASA